MNISRDIVPNAINYLTIFCSYCKCFNKSTKELTLDLTFINYKNFFIDVLCAFLHQLNYLVFMPLIFNFLPISIKKSCAENYNDVCCPTVLLSSVKEDDFC